MKIKLALLDVVRSSIDDVTKCVFRIGTAVLEVSLIYRNDGVHRICVPSQTACNLGCSFCHMTGFGKLSVTGLDAEVITACVDQVRTLFATPAEKLLVAFMGAGEPLLNLDQVVQAMVLIRDRQCHTYAHTRFSFATLIPRPYLMFRMAEQVLNRGLPVKAHWSLHSPYLEVRRQLMPSAGGILEGLTELVDYREITGNPVEIHYALIDGVNDRDLDASELVRLLSGSGVPVKFIQFNERPGSPMKPSLRLDKMRQTLEAGGIETEEYCPPGGDVGASCGQFLQKYYQ